MAVRSIVAAVGLASLLLAGCATQGQSRYQAQEVGHASVVEFGTVLAVRAVDIRGRNSGAGAMVGAAAGGIGMSGVGAGAGNAAAILGGVVAGALVGAMAEQAMSDRVGIEYVITLANANTITIVQEQGAGDRVFNAGERVMVQTNGSYQRVLAADHLPTQVFQPQGIAVIK